MRRCGWCGDNGHNRRTCPKMDKEYKDKWVKPVSTRCCRYCHNEGHTRRTCPKKQTDKAAWIEENKEFRKMFLQDMKESGLGIGAVIEQSSHFGDKYFFLVKEIVWDAITHTNFYANTIVVSDLSIDRGYDSAINAPKHFGRIGDERQYHMKSQSYNIIKVITPSSAIEYGMPEDWLNGVSGVEARFR